MCVAVVTGTDQVSLTSRCTHDNLRCKRFQGEKTFSIIAMGRAKKTTFSSIGRGEDEENDRQNGITTVWVCHDRGEKNGHEPSENRKFSRS